MSFLRATILAIAFASATLALPTASSQEVINPVPGLSDYWNDYRGTEPPYPGNETAPILPTTNGTAGPDDLLWQNLLAGEWIIFNFYQLAVKTFNVSSFTDLGLPNTTYDRIQEIRDNEAGHLAIFQSQISSSSVKPGPCQYDFGYGTDVEAFLVLIPFIEVSSIAVITGLVQQANIDNSKGALTAVAATESRHNTWALIDVQGTNPFGGPSDTVFPYANEILDATNVFTVPDSCPQANPVYPSPRQGLPQLSYNASTNSTLAPGSSVQLIFEDTVPEWNDTSYYVVFYHGVLNITMPFDTKTNTTTIPEFEKNKGVIIGVISNAPGAPTLDSVVAGPVFLLEQPAGVIKELGE